ncbi:hypothetical protein, partial [Streptomyces clavuligerus]|uniref:hypothetical protein n=1 Tax=Streptomyces clavuligerus TaxID=1901 RepID=UPI001E4BBE7E
MASGRTHDERLRLLWEAVIEVQQLAALRSALASTWLMSQGADAARSSRMLWAGAGTAGGLE